MAVKKAPRNRTINLTQAELAKYRNNLLKIDEPVSLAQIIDTTIHQDAFEVLDFMPTEAFDLIVADPPYNLTKSFNGKTFNKQNSAEYGRWLESWVCRLPRLLKRNGSIYICGDWRSSTSIHRVLEQYFTVQNRITWEREKGRGAKNNWKNNSEDIWFATTSGKYYFDVESVKLKRKVMAPYTDKKGKPKDWRKTDEGRYRTTHPSNIWTDLTVPFWSMPENTDHPTQKPEKLLAKIILASSEAEAVVFDPFLGSGTTSVVAKKLGRHYVGIESNLEYCCLAEKRLEMAENNSTVQGYADGVFWERNTLSQQPKSVVERKNRERQPSLFRVECLRTSPARVK